VLGVSVSTAIGQQTGDQLLLKKYNFPIDGPLTGVISNVGSMGLNTASADVFVDGVMEGFIGGSCQSYGFGVNPILLQPQQECNFNVTSLWSGAWPTFRAGAVYSLKIVINVVFEFKVIYGGSSNQPQLANVILPSVATVTLSPTTSSASQTLSSGSFPGDYFVPSAFLMIGVVAVMILVLGLALGLYALSVAHRNRNRGLYGEEPRKIRAKEEEIATPQVEERQVVRLTSNPNSSLAIMAVALSGVVLLVISAFMPWLTIDLSFLGSRASFNLIDFLNLVDFPTRSAGIVLQTIQSTLSMEASPPNAVLVRDTVFFLLLATVFYGLAIAAAVVSFVVKEAWLLFSGAFAILSGLLVVVGIETLKANVIAKGETPAYALLVRPGYGIFLALIAGFVFLGAYFISHQSTLVEERLVTTPSTHCPRCGATTPSDSKFCKECGTRVKSQSSSSSLYLTKP
jgi:ribosomal protein L40E